MADGMWTLAGGAGLALVSGLTALACKNHDGYDRILWLIRGFLALLLAGTVGYDFGSTTMGNALGPFIEGARLNDAKAASAPVKAYLMYVYIGASLAFPYFEFLALMRYILAEKK